MIKSVPVGAFFSILVLARPVYAASQISKIFLPYFRDILGLITVIVPFVLTLAVLFFFWGLAKFVRNSGNEKEHESGKNLMIWGTIAITVMASLWGIVEFMQSVFDIGNIQN